MAAVIIEQGACPFCLVKDRGSLRSDKRGRPYFKCHGCGTIAFIHDTLALRTFRMVLSGGITYKLGEVLAAEKLAPASQEVLHGA